VEEVSRNERRIRDSLAAIGHEPESVRWEPIGLCYEMQGRSGGWMVNDEPIGLNIDAALATIAEFGRRWFPPTLEGNK
jgi:hypothetical protein